MRSTPHALGPSATVAVMNVVLARLFIDAGLVSKSIFEVDRWI